MAMSTMSLIPVFEVGQAPDGTWGVDDIYHDGNAVDFVPPITDGLPSFATKDQAQKIAELLTECYAMGRQYPKIDILKKISYLIGENPNKPAGLHEVMRMHGINPANV